MILGLIAPISAASLKNRRSTRSDQKSQDTTGEVAKKNRTANRPKIASAASAPESRSEATSGFNARLGRWSFGSRPYGYDSLGYPDPFFLFPYSISMDPWARGSFRAPDLHDDPYFYDRVPQQTRRTARGTVRPDVSQRSEAVAQRTQPALELKVIPKTPPAVEFELTQKSEIILEDLQEASSELAESLLQYPGGKKWVKYLRPNMLPIMATNGQKAELNDMLTRYDLTVVQEDSQIIRTIDGFEESRKSLRRFLKSLR